MKQIIEHEHQRLFWINRARRLGPAYVGHVGQDYKLQQKRIEGILRPKLTGHFYQSVLDFGCGAGRFLSLLSRCAGHIWGVDLVPDSLVLAQEHAKNFTPVVGQYPLEFPFKDKSIDLLWAGLVFHHIVDDSLFKDTLCSLSNSLRVGARVLVLDNAQDEEHHVRPRTPTAIAAALGLERNFLATRVTINTRPNDHWLIDGFKEE